MGHLVSREFLCCFMLNHYNDINRMKHGSLNLIHKTGSKTLCSPGYSDSILRSHWLGDTAASEPTQSASSPALYNNVLAGLLTSL